MDYISEILSKGKFLDNYLDVSNYKLVYRVKDKLYIQVVSEEDYVLFKDIFNRIEELLFIIKN